MIHNDFENAIFNIRERILTELGQIQDKGLIHLDIAEWLETELAEVGFTHEELHPM